MTVTDLAPTSSVWPPQVTDRLDADEPWPHPAVKSGSASRPNQATRMNDSVSRPVSVGGRAENYKTGWTDPPVPRPRQSDCRGGGCAVDRITSTEASASA